MSSSSSSSGEGEAEDHDSSGGESASEDAENDSSNDDSEDENDGSEDEKDDTSKSDTNTKESQSKSLVDLDALEEEVIKLEEKMLPFTIFSKRKALDPLHDDLFAESEHEVSHPISSLNDEMQDTDSHLDNLHENFAAIGAQLTDEAHHEKVVKQFEDDEDKDSDDEDLDAGVTEKDSSKRDNKGEDEEVEDTPKTEEDIHASLAKMVRAHVGDDIMNSNEQDGNNEHDSEEEEDDDNALPVSLPDFSNFITEVERTLKKKSKRVSGESQLEQIVGGEKGQKRPPRKGGVKRNRTMPSRLDEEGNFFDWRKHAAKANQSTQQPQGQDLEKTSSSAEKSEGNTSNAAMEQHSEIASSNAKKNEELTTNDVTVEGAPNATIGNSSEEEDSNEEHTAHTSTATGGGYLEAMANGAITEDNKNKGTELTLDYGTYKSEARKKLDEEDGDDPTSDSSMLKLLQDKKEEPPRPGSSELSLDYGTYKPEARKKLDEEDGDDPMSGSSMLKMLQDKKEGLPPPGSSELSLDYGTYKSEARKKLDEEDGDDPTSDSSVLKILQDKNEGVRDDSAAPSLLGDAAKKATRGKSPKKRRGKGIRRNKTAPPDSMRRPGETFFDWKKYAGDQGQETSPRE